MQFLLESSGFLNKFLTQYSQDFNPILICLVSLGVSANSLGTLIRVHKLLALVGAELKLLILIHLHDGYVSICKGFH